jgi:hypothetical protein
VPFPWIQVDSPDQREAAGASASGSGSMIGASASTWVALHAGSVQRGVDAQGRERLRESASPSPESELPLLQSHSSS